jgi:hypothetical protein
MWSNRGTLHEALHHSFGVEWIVAALRAARYQLDFVGGATSAHRRSLGSLKQWATSKLKEGRRQADQVSVAAVVSTKMTNASTVPIDQRKCTFLDHVRQTA